MVIKAKERGYSLGLPGLSGFQDRLEDGMEMEFYNEALDDDTFDDDEEDDDDEEEEQEEEDEGKE
jgi:hypothetical protein